MELNTRNELLNCIFNGSNKAEDAINLVKTDFDKVIYNAAFGKKFDVDFNVKEAFEKIFDKYVPSDGKANTIIGEILRGYNKLMYRYLNDGDDIECGYYSGIIYGLLNEFDVPFRPVDDGIECSYNYDILNMFGYIFNNIVDNIAFNCLILETFEDYHCNNRYVDISKYYKNIIHYLIKDSVINKFKENGIDITNMGSYGNNFKMDSSEFTINSANEDIVIAINNYQNVMDIKYQRNPVKFKIMFDWNEADIIFEKYGQLFRYLFNKAVFNFNGETNMKNDLEKIGYTINNEHYIQKI